MQSIKVNSVDNEDYVYHFLRMPVHRRHAFCLVTVMESIHNWQDF